MCLAGTICFGSKGLFFNMTYVFVCRAGDFYAVKEFSLLDKGSQGKQIIIQLEHVNYKFSSFLLAIKTGLYPSDPRFPYAKLFFCPFISGNIIIKSAKS